MIITGPNLVEVEVEVEVDQIEVVLPKVDHEFQNQYFLPLVLHLV